MRVALTAEMFDSFFLNNLNRVVASRFHLHAITFLLYLRKSPTEIKPKVHVVGGEDLYGAGVSW